jgi:hypothetical protein
MIYTDLQIEENNGLLDISFEEENNARSLVIDTLTKNLRIPFDDNKIQLLEKYGTIGDVLVDEDIRSGSIIWYELRNKNINDILPYIRNDVIFRLERLKSQFIINNYEIVDIIITAKQLQITLKINNDNNTIKINQAI